MNTTCVATAPALTMETRRYLADIRRIKLLDLNEEHMLAKSFRGHNDVNAAHKLIVSHLHLVVKIAMGYRGYGLPIGELISEGNIGLMRAVKRFDPDKGFRLTSYAISWIRSAICDYIFRSWSMVKIATTANHKKLFFKLRRTKQLISALEEGDMRPDQVKVIATRLGVTEHDVIYMNARMSRDTSLNLPVGHDEREWQDLLTDEKSTQENVLIETEEKENKVDALRNALEVLNSRERRIFEARRLLEEPATGEELSTELGISPQRVYQIEMRAFKKVQSVAKRHIARTRRHRVALDAAS